MKPLIWKELRENVRWLPIGLVVVSVVCWMVLPSSVDNYQSVLIASELVSKLAIVLPLLAFSLGIVQSVRDLQPAAGAYLNHRAVTASDIFFSKTISGFVLYLVSVLVPIVVLAIWIAYRGMWWHPMRPAQVGPAIVYAFAAFVMHPAAILTMARGASWWGTRLFPLVPAGTVLIFYFGLLRNGGLRGEMIAMLVAVPMLLWAILISRQGWMDLSKDPPASRTNVTTSRSLLPPAYLLVGACGVFVTVLMTAIGLVEEMSRARTYVPTPDTRFAVDAVSGDPYFTTILQEFDEINGYYTEKLLGGDVIADGKTVNPMSSIQPNKKLLTLNSLIRTGKSFSYSQSDGTNERLTFSIDESSKTGEPDDFSFTFILAGMIPGVMILFAIGIGIWQFFQTPSFVIAFSGYVAEVSSHPVIVSTWVVSLLLALTAGWWLVRRIARACALSRTQSKLWSWSVLLLGLAASLAMIAIYRKVYRETCTKCSEPRRVDLTHCEHCGAAWEALASEGIEIVDRAA
jgi:hypothetical protein